MFTKKEPLKLIREKIGSGLRFASGSYKNQKRIGLKGQLADMNYEGRHGVTKNISQKNIEQMHDILAKHLKKGSTSDKAVVSRRQQKVMLMEVEKLVRSDGSFSREDKKDFKKILSNLRKDSRQSLNSKKQSNSQIKNSNPQKEGTAFFQEKFQAILKNQGYSVKEKEQKKNDFQFGYQFGEKDKKEVADNIVNIKDYQPPQEDKEVKNLRDKAKDLPL